MIEHGDAIGEFSRVVIRQKEAAGAETDIFGLQKRLRQQEVGRRVWFPWRGMMLADPGFLVAEFIEPAQHLQVEVVPLFQPALRRMRGHREISDFHEVSSLFYVTRFLRANRYPLRSKTLCSFRSASLRASESIARQGCGGGMTKHPGQARVARRWLPPSPFGGRGCLGSRDARGVRGLAPRMQTPHPARIAHSR